MKIKLKKNALLLSIMFIWYNSSFSQCNWQTLPNGESVNNIARVREDKKVLRSEVFTFNDGAVYAAYWYADQSVTIVPFNGGAWQVANTTTLDNPLGTVDNLLGWAVGTVGTDKFFVCIAANGVYSKNLSTAANWAAAPLPGAGALTASKVKDLAFHPTSGEVYVLLQPNTTTLSWSKLSGSTFSTYTSMGIVKDVTTNTVYYDDGTFAGASSTANTVGLRNMPQLKFYGSNADALVAYTIKNSQTGHFYPRVMRYNNTTSTWGVVTVTFNSGARQSFINYQAPSGGANVEYFGEDIELSSGPGRPYITIRHQDPNINVNLFVMNLSTNEAHDIFNSNLKSKLILHTYSDANDNFIGAHAASGTTFINKRDNLTGIWATPETIPQLFVGNQFKGNELFISNSNLYSLEGAICRPEFFGDYNSQMPSTSIYKTRSLTAPYNYLESNFWTADLGIPGTHSKVLNGLNNDLIIAYADTMFTDTTYRVAFKKWDGTSWISSGIPSFGTSADAVEDFDIVWDGSNYYLAQVKAAGNCNLLRNSGASSWLDLGIASDATSNGATRFVRVSSGGSVSENINILTASKLGTVNKLNLAQFVPSMFTIYPGISNNLNFQFVETKYHMQAVVVNVNKTLLLYRTGAGGACKYLNGASYADWSASFNTDFSVAAWQSFDAQYNDASGELQVAYNTGGSNTAFKRAKVNGTGDYDQATTSAFTQLGTIGNAVYNTNIFGRRVAFANFGTKVYALTTTYPENKMVMLKGDLSTGVWASGTDFSLGQSRNQDVINSPVYGVVSKWGGNNIHVMNLPSAPAAPVNTTASLIACSGQTKILTVTSAGATVNWFTASTGGSSVGTGNSFTTPVLNGSVTYYAEATSPCGTSVTRTAIALTIGTSPTVTASASSTTVCSGTSVTFTGNGADTYTWNNGVTDNTPFAVTTGGNYIVTGTATNGCTGTATVNMTVNQGPSIAASFSTNDTICQGSIFNINVAAGANTANSITSSLGATYTFSNAINIVANATASYYLQATGPNTCVSKDTLNMAVTITAAPTMPSVTTFVPLTLTGYNHDIVANGSNVFLSTTNSVDATVDGCRFIASDYTQFGTPTRYLPNGGTFTSQNSTPANLPFQFASYIGNNTLTLETGNMSGTLILATPTAMTEFYLLATSGGGSTNIDMTINFTDGSSQIINNQTITDWFNGSDAAIMGTGRYYNGALGFQAPTDNNPRLYQFLIDVANANESKMVQSVSFYRVNPSTAKTQIMAITAVTQLSNQTFCASDFATVSDLQATGTSVQWYSAPTGGSALATSALLANGSYYNTQTLNGCQTYNRGSLSVTVSPSPTRTVTKTLCGSYTIYGTTYTSTGTYYKSVTAPSGCDSIIVLNLTINPYPNVTIQGGISAPLNICEMDTVQLTGQGAGSYQWDNGVINNVPFALTASHLYQVIGTTNGCSDTATIQVNMLSRPTATISSTNTSCTGNTGAVTLTNVSGGTSPYSYIWSNTAQTQNISNVGVGVYSVSIIDDNGCHRNYSISVNANNAPTLSVQSSTNVSCNGMSDGAATIAATGGTSPYTYAWSGNSSTTSSISNLVAAIYTCTVTDASSCSSVQTVSITQPSAINVTTSTNAGTITANATGATYQWINCTNGNIAIAGETNQSFTTTTNGNYAVIVKVGLCSDTSACVAILSVGLNDLTMSNAINVMPNPSSGVFNINLNTTATIQVEDMFGQLIMSEKKTASNFVIDLTNEANGVYMLRVNNANISKVIRLVKSN